MDPACGRYAASLEVCGRPLCAGYVVVRIVPISLGNESAGRTEREIDQACALGVLRDGEVELLGGWSAPPKGGLTAAILKGLQICGVEQVQYLVGIGPVDAASVRALFPSVVAIPPPSANSWPEDRPSPVRGTSAKRTLPRRVHRFAAIGDESAHALVMALRRRVARTGPFHDLPSTVAFLSGVVDRHRASSGVTNSVPRNAGGLRRWLSSSRAY
jgi:hypothetical protein